MLKKKERKKKRKLAAQKILNKFAKMNTTMDNKTFIVDSIKDKNSCIDGLNGSIQVDAIEKSHSSQYLIWDDKCVNNDEIKKSSKERAKSICFDTDGLKESIVLKRKNSV